MLSSLRPGVCSLCASVPFVVKRQLAIGLFHRPGFCGFVFPFRSLRPRVPG
jgi:hypothetical protein